jgi:hypothetical protein
MKEEFSKFANNIRLTPSQKDDAKTKYNGVCKKLHTSYYDTSYDGSTKFLFGSYKTKTNVRPITENQDVDVLFKIPKTTYEKFKAYSSNGPSALLQEVKKILSEKYTTTDNIKTWGKVVKITFADKTHNVEVLPAFEKEDGTFKIPNSENGGSWENFNPRGQIDRFNSSNTVTDGLTADLTRMIKTWVDNTSTCNYKSYKLLEDVIAFLNSNFKSGATYSEYSSVVKSFFKYLSNHCSEGLKNHAKTAFDRAVKAYDFEKEDKPKEASETWRKVFGSEFPLISSNPAKEQNTRVFTNPSLPYGY